MKRVIYRQGKRMVKKKINKKKVIILILIIVAVIVLLLNLKTKANQETETFSDTNTNVVNEVNTTNTGISEDTKKYENVDIPEQLDGYNVLGQLVLDKIEVRQNILYKTEDASLKLGVTKFYGPKINEAGNFCICGLNYNNILKRLDEMNVGDQFFIITRETKERVDYQIYEKYSCDPTDLSCLNQNQDGKKEVTLITCNPGGLTRLICKAREI